MNMIKLNTVINQDCFLGMKEMDNESVNLILTDPPYGIKYQNNYSFNKHRKIKGDEGINYDEFAKECYRVLKNNSHAYFFTRFDEYPEHYIALQKAGFVIKNCLVVEKGNIGGCGDLKGSYASNSEWIIFCVKGKRNFEETKLIKNKKVGIKTNSRGGVSSEYKTRLPSCWFGDEYPKSTYNSSWQKTNGVMHPTVKNSDCLSWLIQISSKEGDIVFDPFGGSGSTFVSAIRTKRKFYGFEIDDQYYNLCNERIEEILRLRAKLDVVEQESLSGCKIYNLEEAKKELEDIING